MPVLRLHQLDIYFPSEIPFSMGLTPAPPSSKPVLGCSFSEGISQQDTELLVQGLLCLAQTCCVEETFHTEHGHRWCWLKMVVGFLQPKLGGCRSPSSLLAC